VRSERAPGIQAEWSCAELRMSRAPSIATFFMKKALWIRAVSV
jgi:hypothetical protein